ncbi:uncharacterized protein LOC131066261 [Cryptomeria japonica]|uniref:uncharacterized protein LOC131066261 n=1 Tax=Cryptomeria japonica TaxID=3369 RepID=UPI0025ABD589|nr:uncharacterized protein LOC131066261 [Cryptomeria japonica]XP_057856971.1 uncharacterized protein LOC131066261 [Cryptomeria japonica]
MAAKVHCETKLHVRFPNQKAVTATRVILKLEDPWPHCPELIKPLKDDRTCSGINNCSDSMQERMEGYGTQDTREILKQTMLKQEEIFQGQVRELHRLYQVQKVLMADLKIKSLGKSKLDSATTQKSHFIFQLGSDHVASEGKRNVRDPPNIFVTDKDKISYRLPICGTDRDHTPFSDFLGKGLPIGLSPKESKDSSQDFSRLQPSRATCRNFDLEQPAAEYVSDKVTHTNNDDRILRIAVKNSTKEDKSLNFSMFLHPDSDVELTLGTGYGKGKTVSNYQKTPSNLGLAFPEFKREQPIECRGPIFNDELKLYSPTSVRSEVTIPENIRTLEGTQASGKEHKNIDKCRTGWQRFDIDGEKSSKERNFLDLHIGERPKQENIKQPPWLLQALNLSRT